MLLDNLHYTQAVDIWSVGVILEEMLSSRREPPYYGSNEIEQLLAIFQRKGTPTPQTLSHFKRYPQLVKLGLRLPQFSKPTLRKVHGFGIDEFIEWMTEVDPCKRPSCSEALRQLQQIRSDFNQELEGGPRYAFSDF